MKTEEVFKYLVLILFLNLTSTIRAVEWQWSLKLNSYISSETNEHPRAFLWIPPSCEIVRAIVIGQHNMQEEGVLEHPVFRKKMSELGIATIWISPGFDQVWDPQKHSQQIFDQMLDSLAFVSGFSELSYAPIIPIGHSAMATFPWNFAAQNNHRTLAVISMHGDAPSTNLTGYGRANLDWTKLNIDGIPGLMIEGEYEWWEARVQPGLNYKNANPNACISFLCDAGHGHFDISEQMIDYITRFIEKSFKYRLPKEKVYFSPVKLIDVNPQLGWLADRWHIDSIPNAESKPFNLYKGKKADAFWYFDKEMAQLTEKIYRNQRGKKSQYIGYIHQEELLNFDAKSHAQMITTFNPESDGLTFHLKAVFTDSLRKKTIQRSNNPDITRICGPVKKMNDTTFTVMFQKEGLNNQRRSNDIWLMAHHKGNKTYKSSVQQFNMKIPFRNVNGENQEITFDSIPDINYATKSLKLHAKSSSGLPVFFYVQDGPAMVVDNVVYFTKLPKRTKYPVKITVVAWQYGRSTNPQIQTARPIAREFFIYK